MVAEKRLSFSSFVFFAWYLGHTRSKQLFLVFFLVRSSHKLLCNMITLTQRISKTACMQHKQTCKRISLLRIHCSYASTEATFASYLTKTDQRIRSLWYTNCPSCNIFLFSYIVFNWKTTERMEVTIVPGFECSLLLKPTNYKQLTL